MANKKDLFPWRRGKKSIESVLICDKNERFVLRNSIVYLACLLDDSTILEKEIFSMLSWVLGNKLEKLGRYLFEIISEKEREEFKDYLRDSIDTDKSIDFINSMLHKSCKKRIIKFLHFAREELYLRHKSLAYTGSSDTEKKISHLAKMFNFSEQEIRFCTFLYIVTAWQKAEEYFQNHLKCHAISGRRYLKTALRMTDKEINTVLSGTLIMSGYCEIKKSVFSATDDFVEYLFKPSNGMSAIKYFSRIPHKTIPLGKQLIDQKKTDHILKLLSIKKNSSRHILLHGTAGSGKTSYAYSLVNKLKVPAYEIVQNENTNKRIAAIMACFNTTNNNDGPVIIVDKADDILKAKDTLFALPDSQDKNGLNQLFEQQGKKVIWITDDIEDIDKSVVRHFSFSLHFEKFNKKQRTMAWESVLCRNRVKKCFSDNELKQLSDSYPVDTTIIDSSIKNALDISSPEEKNFKEAVIMNLNSYMELTKDKDKLNNKNKIENSYSIDGLNVDGDLDAMMDQLKTYDKFLREGDNNELHNFNLLFYGPPGTGKSEFARYIADRLARKIMCKRKSDIVSSYNGETEQNISKVFAKAEAEEAILIIDEADSFLFSRSTAMRSFEISQTNEFLTQMEKFCGILICTTNMLAGMDSASIRRFNHKIKFDYLNSEGNILFYQRLLEPLSKTSIDEDIKNELKEIRQLAPGDFRIVRDRYSFYEQSEITHQKLIEALRKESNIKQFQTSKGKRIGF